MTTPAEDRWPTLAEAAALIFAWLPELEALHIALDNDGIPAAVIDLPGLPHGVVWQAAAHTTVYPDPIDDAKASEGTRAMWDEVWASRYAGRPTRPAAVWRWRWKLAAPVST
jgi:hypothetical protein